VGRRGQTPVRTTAMERRVCRHPAGPLREVRWRRPSGGRIRAEEAHTTQRGSQQPSYHSLNGLLARSQDVQRGAGSQGESVGGRHTLPEAGGLRGEKPLDDGPIHRPKQITRHGVGRAACHRAAPQPRRQDKGHEAQEVAIPGLVTEDLEVARQEDLHAVGEGLRAPVTGPGREPSQPCREPGGRGVRIGRDEGPCAAEAGLDQQVEASADIHKGRARA
jgi:hypothetical protein